MISIPKKKRNMRFSNQVLFASSCSWYLLLWSLILNTLIWFPSSSSCFEESKRQVDGSLQSLPTSATEVLHIHQPNEKQQSPLLTSVSGSKYGRRLTQRRRSYSNLEKLEFDLARSRAAIKQAAKSKTEIPDPDYIPDGPIYHNARAFHRSYLEMEKKFKVFIYREGELPLFHNGPCKGIYSSEGFFISQLETTQKVQTQDPEKAHVYFLPFSVTMMVHYVYVPDSYDRKPMKKTTGDYVDAIAAKYPYWNRSLGADHFMLSCHDWGPAVSTYIPNMLGNSIRALCNANTSEGFRPHKDVSYPEINLRKGHINGMVGGPPASRRTILAFFSGQLHGYIRSILLEHWKNKDPDMQIYERLPAGMSYDDIMKKSKFCICPSGHEVASPRVVEAIYKGCVPVLISKGYVPPFSDILNWKSFSVEVKVEEIPQLKNILMNIPQSQYIRMQKRVVQIRRHFELNSPPKRFDMFYTTLHSIWLRRLNTHISELK